MVTTKIVKTEIGKNFESALKNLHEKVAKVGWLQSIYYIESKIPVAQVAAIQEQGLPSKNIPARPFMRPTIIREQARWKKASETLARMVLIGQLTMADMMEQIGQSARGEIQKTISDIFSPALAESTILGRIRRNSTLSQKKGPLTEKQIGNITKPLIDTGLMYGTLINTVEDA